MGTSKRRSCPQNTHHETCSLGGFSVPPTDVVTRVKRQTGIEGGEEGHCIVRRS